MCPSLLVFGESFGVRRDLFILSVTGGNGIVTESSDGSGLTCEWQSKSVVQGNAPRRQYIALLQ
mgnify:CR=1 FL=1